MKIYSIVVLQKNPDTNEAKILKSASELSQFSFFYKRNVGVSLSCLYFYNILSHLSGI